MSTSTLLPRTETGIATEPTQTETSAPQLISATHTSIPIMVIQSLRHKKTALPFFGTLLSAGIFVSLLYTTVALFDESDTSITTYSLLVLAILLPLLSAWKLGCIYLESSGISSVFRPNTNAAVICAVEVVIGSETVLTIRSWWPLRMARADVERHGIRVATTSAQRWVAENSQPGGKISKYRFTSDTAVSFCRSHLCHSDIEEGHQCSVCLDDLTSCDGVKMRSCGHHFHETCLATWFSQSSRLVCPMCRSDMNSLIPESEMLQHEIKEEPRISVLQVNIEEGVLDNNH